MAANNAPRIALTIIGESVNFDERFPAETGFTETGIGTCNIRKLSDRLLIVEILDPERLFELLLAP
jgi:hypothetical protein